MPGVVPFEPDFAPSTTFWSNLRSVLPAELFTSLASDAVRKADGRCRFCGAPCPAHRLEAHELWHCDPVRRTRTVVGLSAICPPCHEVQHLALALRKGRGSFAAAHLAEVMGLNPDQAEIVITAAFDRWRERRTTSWVSSFGFLHRLHSDVVRRVEAGPFSDLAHMDEQVAIGLAADPFRRRLQMRAEPLITGYAHTENH